AIAKTALTSGVIRESSEAAHEAYEQHREATAAGVQTGRDEDRGIVGTPSEVAAIFEEFEALGTDMVILRAERNDRETIEYLIDDILPEFV
ncbi:MAG: hypothetical protein R3324_15020, partial [Halobacteriales archaeon]|nr:hypothetical protein [Halobacteriales archaeon]